MDSRSPQRYETVVRGELSDRFEDWFDGVDLKTREGHSILSGTLDQTPRTPSLFRAKARGRRDVLHERDGG